MPSHRGEQRRWTPELITAFLIDWRTQPHHDVARKYKISVRSAEGAYYLYRKAGYIPSEQPMDASPPPPARKPIKIDPELAARLMAQAERWIAAATKRREPRPVPVYYAQLMVGGCRYALGVSPSDPGFRFCPEQNIPGEPWCPEHRAKVWIGKPERKAVTREREK